MNARIEFFRNQIGKEKWGFDYPLMEWLRARVLEVEEDQVKMQFTVEKYMLNPIGIMHGGISATMLDELMGAAGYLQGRPTGFATINLNVDYLNSARAGEIITGTGMILRAGKNVMHAESRIYNAEYKLLAKASSNLIATSFPVPG